MGYEQVGGGELQRPAENLGINTDLAGLNAEIIGKLKDQPSKLRYGDAMREFSDVGQPDRFSQVIAEIRSLMKSKQLRPDKNGFFLIRGRKTTFILRDMEDKDAFYVRYARVTSDPSSLKVTGKDDGWFLLREISFYSTSSETSKLRRVPFLTHYRVSHSDLSGKHVGTNTYVRDQYVKLSYVSGSEFSHTVPVSSEARGYLHSMARDTEKVLLLLREACSDL